MSRRNIRDQKSTPRPLLPDVSAYIPPETRTSTHDDDCAWTSHLKVKIRVFVSISNRLKFFIHFQHINIEESDRTAATAVVTITPTPEHNEIRVDFHLTTTLSCQPSRGSGRGSGSGWWSAVETKRVAEESTTTRRESGRNCPAATRLRSFPDDGPGPAVCVE